MNKKAVAASVAGALIVGLVVGMGIGGTGGKSSQPSGPGPKAVEAGVPVGFERSKKGAVAAAAAYAGAVGSMALASPESRTAALAAMTAPDSLATVREGMEPGFAVLAKGLGTLNKDEAIVRAAPLAYRVPEYSKDSARVELWAVAVIGSTGGLAPRASWGITTVDLRWVGGDWKLAALLKQSEGPTPEQAGAATAAAELISSIGMFTGLDHVPAQ